MNASKNTVKNVTTQILAAEKDHRRCVIQSTLIGNNRDNNKSNLNQAVLKRNWDADPQNFPHDRTARLEVAFFQNDAPAFQNNGKGNN